MHTALRIDTILTPDRVLLNLPQTDKEGVLRAMTDVLARQGLIRDSREITRLLLEREALMTTGVKRGFAFPHAFTNQVDESFLTVGVAPAGVEYQALDGHPVEFIFLLLGPPGHQTVHLRILARISRITGDGEMLDLLRAAQSAEEIMDCLTHAERHLNGPAPRISSNP
ncbi:MAG TPA: PTS sugar transporter subunit IIA [Candidatus Sumerlaeota bacterium]|nr:PTS sugar transporter subunit IIA [Candidatus Sumerlaeota bacterium]HOR29458.1 PTS sugar transporter subunit IIA [Candidatus Sumerlaeota bacterium]